MMMAVSVFIGLLDDCRNFLCRKCSSSNPTRDWQQGSQSTGIRENSKNFFKFQKSSLLWWILAKEIIYINFIVWYNNVFLCKFCVNNWNQGEIKSQWISFCKLIGHLVIVFLLWFYLHFDFFLFFHVVLRQTRKRFFPCSNNMYNNVMCLLFDSE